jgi:hypothetical protein
MGNDIKNGKYGDGEAARLADYDHPSYDGTQRNRYTAGDYKPGARQIEQEYPGYVAPGQANMGKSLNDKNK